MTTPITKEQLTDDVLQDIYYVAVSCEPAEQNGAYMASFDLLCKADDVGGVAYVVRKLIDMLRAERRKAAMDAEPAGYHVIKECGQVGCSVATFEEAQSTRDFWNKRWTIKPYFYAAPPAPVVPDEMAISDDMNLYQKSFAQGHNACRAAMLQGKAEPVSQPYKLPQNSFTDAELEMMAHGDNPQANAYRELLAFRRKLPELIEGMEVSIDVSTCDADAGNRYFGTVTELSELDGSKNGYILLVQDAKPNFDVNGNSPVNQDGSANMLRRWLAFGRAMQSVGSQLPRNLIAETESMLAAPQQEVQSKVQEKRAAIREEMAMGSRLTNQRFRVK